MKKLLLLLLVIIMTAIPCTAFAASAAEIAVEENADILAVFAAQKKQPRAILGPEKTKLDTLWIFFTNGNFRQYVIQDQILQLYSCGTYAFDGDGGFLYQDKADFDAVSIHRTHKYMEGMGFGKYSSIHPIIMYGEEYTMIVSPEETQRKALAVFGGVDMQPYETPAGESLLLDTYWIYYSDGTFEQFADLDNQIIPFSTGTYSFPENETFYHKDTGKPGIITVVRNTKTQDNVILNAYNSEHDYDLSTMDYVLLSVDFE